LKLLDSYSDTVISHPVYDYSDCNYTLHTLHLNSSVYSKRKVTSV